MISAISKCIQEGVGYSKFYSHDTRKRKFSPLYIWIRVLAGY